MADSPTDRLLKRIKAAGLGYAAYFTAREMLDRMDEATGQTRISVAELEALLDQNGPLNERTRQRHLNALRGIGCAVHKSGDIYLIIWPLDPTNRQKMSDDRQKMSVEGAEELTAPTFPVAQPAKNVGEATGNVAHANGDPHLETACATENVGEATNFVAQPAKNVGPPIRARAPALVSQLASSDPLPEEKLTNYPPPPEFPAASCGTQNGSGVTLAASEVAVSEALLRAAGMSRRKALALASAHPFYLVQKATARWWYGRRSKGGRFREEPGIVVRMLEDPDEYNLASYAIPESWWYTDLGRFQPPSRRRHRGQTHRGQTPPLLLAESAPQAAPETWQQDIEENDLEEMGRDAGATCGAPPDPAPPGSPSALCAPVNWRRPGAEGTTDPLQAAWAQLLDELATGMPGLYGWLEGSVCAPDPDGNSAHIIVAKPRGLDYAQRAAPALTRRLGSILGRTVKLEIVAEVEQPHESQLAG